MSRRAVILAVLLVVGTTVYGLVDIRNRARTDRGPKYHRTDFTVYQAAAAALRDGTDPYEAENPRGLRYVYPPLLAVLLMPVAGLPGTSAALLFFAISFATLVWIVRSLARLPSASPRAAGVALLVCVAFFHQSFQRGQVTILLLGFEVAGLLFLLSRRELAAGFVLALGGAIRIVPLFPAAAAGMGALFAIRRRGAGPFLRLTAGVLIGLVVGFAAIPATVLGPARAKEVTARWIEMARSVYAAAPGELADLAADYGINEYRFKNQSPRRVAASYTGWARGAVFEREKPDLPPRVWRAVDLFAFAAAAAAVLALLVLGGRRLRNPDDPGFSAAFAATLVLPLFAERYVWPTHWTAVYPLLALSLAPAGAGRFLSRPFLVFLAATLLFYASYADVLEPIGAAGPLLLGSLILLAGVLRKPW